MTIEQALKRLPKPGMPADLAAAIEQETVFKKRGWNSDGFQRRWLPALVGLATVFGVLWLSHIQKHPDPTAILPIAAVPAPAQRNIARRFAETK